ncbi:MAG: cytidylate kinase [Pseudomonadota bacterium]
MTFTIAIDGPAAAGKGTLSRRIADTYGFHHLDTGLTYRATAKALLDAGLPLDDEEVAETVALNLNLAGLDRAVLSQHAIGEAASKIAVMPKVRRALVEAQRMFAAKEPGTVLDGRDIGTVVCARSFPAVVWQILKQSGPISSSATNAMGAGPTAR